MANVSGGPEKGCGPCTGIVSLRLVQFLGGQIDDPSETAELYCAKIREVLAQAFKILKSLIVLGIVRESNAAADSSGAPSDLLLTDSLGRRNGILGGQIINESPEVEVAVTTDLVSYEVPGTDTFTATAKDAAGGTLVIDASLPAGHSSNRILAYRGIVPPASAVASAALGATVTYTTLHVGDKTYAPTVDQLYSGTSGWQIYLPEVQR